MTFKEIDNNYKGGIPAGFDLVVVEKKEVLKNNFNGAMVLYGFDEIGMFTNTTMGFVSPIYGFLGEEKSLKREEIWTK